jgi:hypothetical protein
LFQLHGLEFDSNYNWNLCLENPITGGMKTLYCMKKKCILKLRKTHIRTLIQNSNFVLVFQYRKNYISVTRRIIITLYNIYNKNKVYGHKKFTTWKLKKKICQTNCYSYVVGINKGIDNLCHDIHEMRFYEYEMNLAINYL